MRTWSVMLFSYNAKHHPIEKCIKKSVQPCFASFHFTCASPSNGGLLVHSYNPITGQPLCHRLYSWTNSISCPPYPYIIRPLWKWPHYQPSIFWHTATVQIEFLVKSDKPLRCSVLNSLTIYLKSTPRQAKSTGDWTLNHCYEHQMCVSRIITVNNEGSGLGLTNDSETPFSSPPPSPSPHRLSFSAGRPRNPYPYLETINHVQNYKMTWWPHALTDGRCPRLWCLKLYA